MESYRHYAESIVFAHQYKKTIVTDHHPDLECIGIGRSAAAFRIKGKDLVVKVFFPEFESIAQEEAEIYSLLSDSHFYPSIYDSGPNYLVIDYVEGKTFFTCLTDGTFIKKRYVEEVDEALEVARNAGLTPSDVHLRNMIVLPDDHVKLIDLARFRQLKEDDSQWDDLKGGWPLYSRPWFPKKIPAFLLNRIAFIYKKSPRLFKWIFHR
ncbi:protein kinase family protein [Jeotgalibacillus sp. R-1-5s-1]|uniref:protein kinase family protein n=1 Tax=Jeotgalibacillus sp. R-1-5s-1 TaxID=2555897 RepID=UPI00106D6C16|nr:protein kinase family protein [Jeotgalibacillus sp. R-1-5s-1]TFE00117.1 protein kinase family protein [Jeotgalibacillus sp. R-1-5s-1]